MQKFQRHMEMDFCGFRYEKRNMNRNLMRDNEVIDKQAIGVYKYKHCELRWFSGWSVCWHSPDDLEAGGTVLVVLGVGLQVVNVDVRQTRQQQLQLLLVEDGDKSAIMTLYL